MELVQSSLVATFGKVREHSLRICKPLKTEDFLPQPAEFVSPAKWHLAHTTWFFEYFMLIPHRPNYKPFDSNFNYLFNSYYNTLGNRVERQARSSITRPTVDEVMAYRAYVDSAMNDWLAQGLTPEQEKLLAIGLNHEQQHQELLFTDLKYSFFRNPVQPAYEEGFSLVDDKVGQNSWLNLTEGIYEIGHTGEGFSYDNEHARHKVYLHNAKISTQLVSNKDYLSFIEDGGYRDHQLWLDEGWTWLQQQEISKPLYWEEDGGQWNQFTLGGWKMLDPEAALAHISHYEANAFAQWAGCRLPTEFEWEALSDQLEWGRRWEHTGSAYLAYPGYKKPDGAVGEYNGKFMMNQMVLRGASRATPDHHSRATYRNFFHPEMRWQFSGIRLAKDE